jgi:serine/threonine protein kinase
LAVEESMFMVTPLAFVAVALIVLLIVVVGFVLLAMSAILRQRRMPPRTDGRPASAPRSCPGCGAALAFDAPHGLCPACLLKQGLAPSAAGIPTDYPRRGSTPVASEAVGGFTARYRGPFTAPTPAELAPLFPQLEVLELLGQGGMGAVYKARQPRLDRTVALKILPPGGSDDPAFAERFMREARTLARLDHPGIVRLHDFGESAGLHYFVMEYVDGSNIRQLMKAGGLTKERALAIVPQVCDALQYAHDEGIIHRDIKPENILLDRRGRVKIADFGLAKLLGRTPADPTLTGTHQVMGTPHYMAPEQVERPLTVDARADVYALGVVLYEMLTGELPLGQFAPPSQKGGGEVRIDSVVLRALAREPERRFSTPREMKSALLDVAPLPADVVLVPVPLTTGPASVPFEISNCRGGLGQASGIVRIEGDELVVEYGVTFVSLFRTGVREARINLRDVQHVSLRRGWFSDVLAIHATRLSVLGDLPMNRPGQVVLELSKRDADAAERFVSRLSALVRVEQTPRPAREARRAGLGITIAAIFVALAGAVFTFMPMIPWAYLHVRSYYADMGFARTPTAEELQKAIRAHPPEQIELIRYFGFDHEAGIVAFVAFLVLPLVLIATIGMKRWALLRPITIMVFAGVILIATLCYSYDARVSRTPFVSLTGPGGSAGGSKGLIPNSRNADGSVDYRGEAYMYLMGRSMHCTASAQVPANPGRDKIAVLCSLGDEEFILTVDPPGAMSEAPIGRRWPELQTALASRVRTRSATGVYLAMGIGVALLFLAAAQFVVVVRVRSAGSEPAAEHHSEPMNEPSRHGGPIRSFAGRIYSLIFESRVREESTSPYQQYK